MPGKREFLNEGGTRFCKHCSRSEESLNMKRARGAESGDPLSTCRDALDAQNEATPGTYRFPMTFDIL